LLYQQKTKTNSFLLQYASAIHPHQENFKTKTKRKEIAKMPKDAISHKVFPGTLMHNFSLRFQIQKTL
jgi:hypothetical protein